MPEQVDFHHQPVLLEESLGFLCGREPEGLVGTVVDCTVGLGGHAIEILRRCPRVHLVAVDRDAEALARARRRLEPWSERTLFVHCEYHRVRESCAALGIELERPVLGILADLGVSSMQLDDAQRGFSFRWDAPLDMRMDTSRGRTAADLVADASGDELVKILKEYGEERHARRIARRIVERREEEPIETTGQLRDLVHAAVPTPPRSRQKGRSIDPATRTFQALRLEVNQELAGLEQFLEQSIDMLDTEGRLVVISYHSLEDRIVKHSLRRRSIGEIDPVTGRERAETRLVELLTRKPVRPSDEEVQSNPRSRSARLRAAKRL